MIAKAKINIGSVRDYVALTKPRLIAFVLITTAAGFYLGSDGTASAVRFVTTLIGTAVTAAGALALNQYAERDTDALMERTRRRPLPDGRLRPVSALMFGAALSIAGIGINSLLVNFMTGMTSAVTLIVYIFIYTPMKRRTSLCSIVGAVPGALPPVGGWVASGGELGPGALLLFAILFFWQIPHSLAIAWICRKDYALAKLQVLPVIYPDGRATGNHMVLNSMALLPIGLMPSIVGISGNLYFMAALILGIVLIVYAIKFARIRTTSAARKLLFTCYAYMPLQLGVMSIDRLI